MIKDFMKFEYNSNLAHLIKYIPKLKIIIIFIIMLIDWFNRNENIDKKHKKACTRILGKK